MVKAEDGISGIWSPIITNCYSAGNIERIQGSAGAIGGVFGYTSNDNEIENIKNTYYLKFSTVWNGWGSKFDVDGVTMQLQEEDMKNNSEFITKLNNDTDVWVQDSTNINDSYPILKWMLCDNEETEWKISNGELVLKWQN